MHNQISPAILYWGTPIVLITTENEDGTSNISPISSAWWLAHRCMIGLSASSHTTKNLLRTKHCVLNLPTDGMTSHINALARTTGSDPVSEWKTQAGYVHIKDKFQHAGLTPQASDLIAAPRIKECPVQMEAELMETHEMMKELPDRKGMLLALELKILRVHVEDELRLEGHANRINTDKLRLILMCFQEYYGMGREKLSSSNLARINEEHYRPLTTSGVEGQAADAADADDVEHR
jgi:flavin reductase (DIM6/NTAB) family NADH-FMN oxidoreductase RutF